MCHEFDDPFGSQEPTSLSAVAEILQRPSRPDASCHPGPSHPGDGESEDLQETRDARGSQDHLGPRARPGHRQHQLLTCGLRRDGVPRRKVSEIVGRSGSTSSRGDVCQGAGHSLSLLLAASRPPREVGGLHALRTLSAPARAGRDRQHPRPLRDDDACSCRKTADGPRRNAALNLAKAPELRERGNEVFDLISFRQALWSCRCDVGDQWEISECDNLPCDLPAADHRALSALDRADSLCRHAEGPQGLPGKGPEGQCRCR
mmetsp:Transcript_19299/g.41440  ORF Transcript_19299/g.41440 Transcript_19299/m.41440 type:complete len:261 (-) Transcript_19299:729-1511(-)